MNLVKQLEDQQLLQSKVPLANKTSWRVGGAAELYFRPNSVDELQALLKTLPVTQPVTWLGLGSNVLIRDGGLPGVVIHTLNGLNRFETLSQADDHVIVRIEAGVTCAKVAKMSARNAWVKSEFFAGIPGTMGGALAMNAGAFGSETWDLVVGVEMINRQGEIIFRHPSEFKIGYRTVDGPMADEWFLAAHLQLPLGDSVAAATQIKALLKKRNDAQPIGTFSCGSVFRNPKEDYAARLIEASKLKGTRLGHAMVATKHANFILNLGQADAYSIEALINYVKASVWHQHGVLLQPEVRILGTMENLCLEK